MLRAPFLEQPEEPHDNKAWGMNHESKELQEREKIGQPGSESGSETHQIKWSRSPKTMKQIQMVKKKRETK
jgi:hypothetical protein